jgi:radical S-adenosyl methionine domain-containing protein 2
MSTCYSYFGTNITLFGRFLNCANGGKTPGRSLLEVGVEEALKDAGFDDQAFIDRGGIFEWSRSKDNEKENPLEW